MGSPSAKKNTGIKVSCYIPCFNGEEYLDRCIAAVRKQSYPFDEIIVIDDGSTDRTREKAAACGARVISNGINSGLGFSRNRGVRECRNTFVASVDADCVLDRRWLERIMRNFNENKIVGVCGNLKEFHCETAIDLWRAVHMRQNWGARKARNPHFLFGSNVVFRKDALEHIGLYDPHLKTNYEDVDISLRAKKKGLALIYEPEAVAWHMKKDSLSSLMKNSWSWTLFSYALPRSIATLMMRWLTDSYKAFRYMLDDVIHRRFVLIPLDFLVLPSHLFFDMRYYLRVKFLKSKI